MPGLKPLLFLATGLVALAGCQSGNNAKEDTVTAQPAVLATASPENLSALRAQIGTALGRANPDFGPGDLTQTGVLSVLPPRLSDREGNSPALPVIFDLLLIDGACMARNRADGGDIPLPGVSCRPA
jgi:hypothetical protein